MPASPSASRTPVEGFGELCATVGLNYCDSLCSLTTSKWTPFRLKAQKAVGDLLAPMAATRCGSTNWQNPRVLINYQHERKRHLERDNNIAHVPRYDIRLDPARRSRPRHGLVGFLPCGQFAQFAGGVIGPGLQKHKLFGYHPDCNAANRFFLNDRGPTLVARSRSGVMR